MHLQSTYTQYLQYLQSETHLECSRTSAVSIFAEIVNVLIKAIGYFRRRAPLWIFDGMFDRILNASPLPNNLL